MNPRALAATVTDRRGSALPLALLALIVLSALILAFSALSASEPVIANNQLMVAQARAIAEAGLERALWALNNPGLAGGLANPLPGAIPAPYDGSQFVAVSADDAGIGGFRVTVASGAAPHERSITADGWAPNDSATPRAKQRIAVTVSQIRFLDPPAALAVRAGLELSGDSTVDARADASCGSKAGSVSLGATTVGSGTAAVYGQDGNNVKNQDTDAPQNQPESTFDTVGYSNAELNMLKALARATGTYYRGAVAFDSSRRIPNGIVYVDTVSGGNIDAAGPGTTPASDFASVSIGDEAPADPGGAFSGWLIVAGSLSISGSFQMRGLVYVLGDLSHAGAGQIEGAVITRNLRAAADGPPGATLGGAARITYSCGQARTGGGQVPGGFLLKPGAYKEVAG